MSTMKNKELAIEASREGNAVALYSYTRITGQNLYKVCWREIDIQDLYASPLIERGSIQEVDFR